jgi:hypothetical protein
MLEGIWLVVLGILGAPSLIIAKKPNAKELIDKIAPYQGWIGAVSAVWGLIGIIRCLFNIRLLGLAPLSWLIWLVASVVLAALGLLLGVGVFKSFIKNPTAQAKMDQTITKLAPYQGKLGVAAIGLGLLAILLHLFLRFG